MFITIPLKDPTSFPSLNARKQARSNNPLKPQSFDQKTRILISPSLLGTTLEPQILPHEAKARQSAKAKQTHPAMDSIEDRKYHQVRTGTLILFCGDSRESAGRKEECWADVSFFSCGCTDTMLNEDTGGRRGSGFEWGTCGGGRQCVL